MTNAPRTRIGFNRYAVVAACAVALLMLTGLANPVGGIRTFQVACLASAPVAVTDSKGVSALRVWNNSATPVYLGSSAMTGATNGMPICTATASCIAADMPIDGGGLYCLSSSGTVTVTVIAGR